MSPLSAPILAVFLSLITLTHATTFTVVNNCPFTVWAAADPGSGQKLDQGQTWSVNPAPGTSMARIWPRTGCNFDGSGNGPCETGGCGKLDCDDGHWGDNPKTLFEYTLANPSDTLDISLIEGFNVPLSFSPNSNAGALDGKCRAVSCGVDINAQCPQQWKTTGGCTNPCTTPGTGTCADDGDSKFFKNLCPDAYSFPKADQTSTFSCPSGTDYTVTFCP
ncbi:thaumatin-like protein 1 [Beta vulgaris subsp. vulgaris]|uniref:thaumatin-like protein 1 n=1 Tax=Beta vulgaris subsp. vulgaris TaxID=3555 RepID=UPI0020367E55|nr:thaumatin-like protein 1 [Beta vulgaris subsp. vulgaris]